MAKLFFSGLLLVLLLSSCGDLETELASLTINPASATVGISQAQNFTVVAKDSAGFIVQVSSTWSVSGGIGSINANGLFTANSSTGEGSVVATYGSITDSAAVTITDKCWIEGKVKGDEDSGGVYNILVTAREASRSDRTDANGDYSISNLPAGTYEVYVEDKRTNPIYLSSTYEVTVASGETGTQNFFLYARSDRPEFPEPPEISD